MSKELPILFSADMVNAILAGNKTQTRRIIKPQPDHDAIITVGEIGTSRGAAYIRYPMEGGITTRLPCKYGSIGDKLWVRETWRIGAWNEDEGSIAVDYMADNYSRREWLEVPSNDKEAFSKYWIQSTDDAIKSGLQTDSDDRYSWDAGKSPCRIRPSIFMPRWASRILLEITDIRVERLNDISESDARAEGCRCNKDTCAETGFATFRESYESLWERINGEGSWAQNQFVWVISFKRI